MAVHVCPSVSAPATLTKNGRGAGSDRRPVLAGMMVL